MGQGKGIKIWCREGLKAALGLALLLTSATVLAADLVLDGGTSQNLTGAGPPINFTNEVIGFNTNGTFNQSGSSNTVDAALLLGFNSGANGIYNHSGGTATVSGSLLLGNNAGANGAYNLSGTGNLATASAIIGNSGTGVFTQTGGSHSGGGLIVGVNSGSSGTYTHSGGTATMTGSLLLGNDAGAIGNYDLSGTGSLAATAAVIGNSGTGIFTQTGGSHSGGDLIVGVNSGSSGTYNQSGGTTSVTSLAIAANAGSSGTFSLLGSNLTATTILVNTGGTFNQTGGTIDPLALGFNNLGVFNYSGGIFSGRLLHFGVVNFNADFTAGNGMLNASTIPLTIAVGRTITLNGQGLDNQSSLIVNGTLAGNGPLLNNTTGTLIGTGTIGGNYINSGIMSSGNSVGTLNVLGSFTQTATGNLVVEVASPASYDQIAVSGAPGSASLSGTVTPVLLGGYLPVFNQLFPGVIATTGGLTGTFATVANQEINFLKIWRPVYTAANFNLKVGADFTKCAPTQTANQFRVGAMLNNIADSATGDLNFVLDTIADLPNCGTVGTAFSQIYPEKAATLPTLALAGPLWIGEVYPNASPIYAMACRQEACRGALPSAIPDLRGLCWLTTGLRMSLAV